MNGEIFKISKVSRKKWEFEGFWGYWVSYFVGWLNILGSWCFSGEWNNSVFF